MRRDDPKSKSRLPHASLNGASRLPKAEKIARLLALRIPDGRQFRILEVGCGSGVIAQYFGCLLGERGQVDAVDIVDQRVATSEYRFQRIEDTRLPFPDHVFDVVISNHVIEHVGTEEDQRSHLRELSRVLRDDGRGYLAVPSRWQLIEPHYHLAFLSWLPHNLRSTYLRWRRRGDFYDCEPLDMHLLESFFQACGLEYDNQFTQAIGALATMEGKGALGVRLASMMPTSLLHALRVTSPTHVYLFAKNRAALTDE